MSNMDIKLVIPVIITDQPQEGEQYIEGLNIFSEDYITVKKYDDVTDNEEQDDMQCLALTIPVSINGTKIELSIHVEGIDAIKALRNFLSD